MFFPMLRMVRMMTVKFIHLFIALIITLPFMVRGGVYAWSLGRTYALDDAPHKRVGIVYGAMVYSNGRLSAMLADRVKAGAELYHAGQVDVLLMTGDNSSPAYNEPEAMFQYAVSLGVPPHDIVVDYGGRRTYDSCYRARYIFGVRDAVLLTQEFHMPRALLTCTALGIDAVGAPVDELRPWGYSERSLAYSRARELPANIVAVLDVLRRHEPPVMGEPLPIFSGDALD